MKRHYWLIVVAGAGLSLALAMLLVAASPVFAAGPPWYARGNFNSWGTTDQMYDDGTHGDVSANDGIYSVVVSPTAAARHEWKVDDGSWTESYPSSNAWLATTLPNQPVLLTFDINVYADGWSPISKTVNALDSEHTWVAVGDWQEPNAWDNASPTTTMTLQDGFYQYTTYISDTGTHDYKVVVSGTWDAIGPQGSSGGRSINTDNLAFNTTYPKQKVTFYADASTGRIKVHVWTPVVINEFTAKGTEWIELCNTTNATVDLSGWSAWNGTGSTPGSSDGSFPGGTIGPDGYKAWNTALSLSNNGDHIWLISGTLSADPIVDMVGYGDQGGAPIAHTGGGVDNSTARTPNGWDTDDDARDWNVDTSPTNDAENDAPGVSLGSSLVINEFEGGISSGHIELYNPTASAVTLTDWMYSDGDMEPTAITTTAGVMIPASGFFLFQSSAYIGSTDVLCLFKSDGVRVDQMGYGGTSPSGTFQRLPDGVGPNDGYDWSSSGGGITLFDLPETLGETNAALFFEKDAPTITAPGELFTYTIAVTNRLGITLNNVVISDVIPVSVTFAYALDGGVKNNGYISWTTSTLPNLGSLVVRFAVTATNDAPAVIFNDDYMLDADELTSPRTGSSIFTLVDTATSLAIHHIQWAAHTSPFEGQSVENIHGIVTALYYNGFYMQDPNPDADDATSEGIFVYTGGAPTVSVGDEVLVDGDVSEYYPGGYATGNLSTSQLGNATIVVSDTGQALPAPIVIGTGGRVPPNQVICGDCAGDVETSPFNPDTDGIDFYESLEAMLVQVNDAIVVAGTSYGTISVVGDNGANAGLLAPRGGIVIRPDDFNPERILIDDAIVANEPSVDTGAAFSEPITGVIGYSYGNFNLLNVNPLPPFSGGVVSETKTAPVANQLRVASFNVYNLDPGDDATRVAGLASQIVNHLQSPDIIGLQEIQDNNGETDNGTVAADQTYGMLIAAIQAAGGPTYQYRQIDPQNNMDGGAPGANIRVGFLFRTDRGLAFVDRPGGDATTAVGVVAGAAGAELTLSPGRIDPTNVAFTDSRKPLAGEFTFNGHKLIVAVNHFNSKGGDTPLFGRPQPPVLASEVQRIQQAQVVNDFVDSILALDPDANVIVLGDLNDFQFSTPVSDTLAADVLTNLVNTLPADEQYTYIYQGNSQVLDHVLLGNDLFDTAFVGIDIVHVNAEFAYSSLRPSDHDPVVATLLLEPPDLSGSTKTVEPAGDVSAGGLLTYTVTLSNSGGANVLVTVTDTLPAELTLVQGFDGGGLTWSGVVNAGEEVVLTLVAQAKADLTANATVTNVVTIDDGVNAAFDVYSPKTNILVPGLTVTKDVTPTTDLPLGSIVTYTITLNNGGDGVAEGVAMTDDLPAEVSFGGWVQQSGATQAGGEVSWTGDMASGAQVVIVFTATVGSEFNLNGQTVTNTASITSDNAGSGSDDATFTIKKLWRTHLPMIFKGYQEP